MSEFLRNCNGLPEFVKICKNLSEILRICKNEIVRKKLQETARLYKNFDEFVSITTCKSICKVYFIISYFPGWVGGWVVGH